jgi:hypothetical protein
MLQVHMVDEVAMFYLDRHRCASWAIEGVDVVPIRKALLDRGLGPFNP